jgi:hypothetical protein
MRLPGRFNSGPSPARHTRTPPAPLSRYVIHEANRHGAAQLYDEQLNVRMQFVELAAFGPYGMRRSAFHEVGGLDEGLSEPGQCGIWSDWELCMRAWLAGHQVVHMFAPRDGDGEPGGTHRSLGVGRRACGLVAPPPLPMLRRPAQLCTLPPPLVPVLHLWPGSRT